MKSEHGVSESWGKSRLSGGNGLNWVLKDEKEFPRKISEEKAFHKQETLCAKI